MKTSKVKEKLSRLPSTQGVFTKIKAVFSTAQASVDESEHIQSLPSSPTFKEIRAYQLEAELLRAQAQEMAHRIRQRIA